MRAQDVRAQLKKPQRQKLSWMKDDEDTPAASGDLLAAPTPAPVAAAAVATEAVVAAASATEAATVAMSVTETEPAEAAATAVAARAEVTRGVAGQRGDCAASDHHTAAARVICGVLMLL